MHDRHARVGPNGSFLCMLLTPAAWWWRRAHAFGVGMAWVGPGFPRSTLTVYPLFFGLAVPDPHITVWLLTNTALANILRLCGDLSLALSHALSHALSLSRARARSLSLSLSLSLCVCACCCIPRYKHVHSLHHKSYITGPWSGLVSTK